MKIQLLLVVTSVLQNKKEMAQQQLIGIFEEDKFLSDWYTGIEEDIHIRGKKLYLAYYFNGDINDFVNVDFDHDTFGVLNEDDNLQSVRSKHVLAESSEEVENGDETTDCVTLEYGEVALNLLVNFMESSLADIVIEYF
ncbi:hypothetical protein FQA39_LY03337 [Lamprigera yunnana]|nr:hypothetical protein FQA39_LY03337 [Lamprigera yunnana]